MLCPSDPHSENEVTFLRFPCTDTNAMQYAANAALSSALGEPVSRFLDRPGAAPAPSLHAMNARVSPANRTEWTPSPMSCGAMVDPYNELRWRHQVAGIMEGANTGLPQPLPNMPPPPVTTLQGPYEMQATPGSYAQSGGWDAMGGWYWGGNPQTSGGPYPMGGVAQTAAPGAQAALAGGLSFGHTNYGQGHPAVPSVGVQGPTALHDVSCSP